VKEHFPYLFWAYNLTWVFLAAYLGVLMAKQRALRRQIEDLKSRLEGEPGRKP
jgi:CcmD family protein